MGPFTSFVTHSFYLATFSLAFGCLTLNVLFTFDSVQMGNFKVFLLLDAQFDWLKEAALCVDFLNDDCALNEKCILLHNLYKTPYLWQHKNIAGTSWINFEKDTNENIEQAFCDPSKTKSGSNNPQFQINFKQVSKINKTHFTNGRFPVLFRRLSTRSSVINNKFAKPGVTHWKWYWEKSQNIWEEYKIWVRFFFIFFLFNFFF